MGRISLGTFYDLDAMFENFDCHKVRNMKPGDKLTLFGNECTIQREPDTGLIRLFVEVDYYILSTKKTENLTRRLYIDDLIYQFLCFKNKQFKDIMDEGNKILVFYKKECHDCDKIKKIFYDSKYDMITKYINCDTEEGLEIAKLYDIEFTPTLIVLSKDDGVVLKFDNSDDIEKHFIKL